MVALRSCIGFEAGAHVLSVAVSQRQFVVMASTCPTPALQRLTNRISIWREAFRMFDTDGSGDISADELAEFSTKV